MPLCSISYIGMPLTSNGHAHQGFGFTKSLSSGCQPSLFDTHAKQPRRFGKLWSSNKGF